MANTLNNIDAVVLCGGLGTRLKPEIGDSQKTMAVVDGRPFLEILLEYIRKQGFIRVVLCVGYQAQEVEKYFAGRDTGLQIKFSREESPLGTGGAIKQAKDLIQSEPFVVFNGDSFCDIDCQSFCSFHLDREAMVSIAISKVADQSDFGSIGIDSTGAVVSFQEKAGKETTGSALGFVNAGVYCCSRGVFDKMPKEERFSLEQNLFSKILSQGFYGFSVAEPFVDIGTPERYQQAQQVLRKKM